MVWKVLMMIEKINHFDTVFPCHVKYTNVERRQVFNSIINNRILSHIKNSVKIAWSDSWILVLVYGDCLSCNNFFILQVNAVRMHWSPTSTLVIVSSLILYIPATLKNSTITITTLRKANHGECCYYCRGVKYSQREKMQCLKHQNLRQTVIYSTL